MPVLCQMLTDDGVTAPNVTLVYVTPSTVRVRLLSLANADCIARKHRRKTLARFMGTSDGFQRTHCSAALGALAMLENRLVDHPPSPGDGARFLLTSSASCNAEFLHTGKENPPAVAKRRRAIFINIIGVVMQPVKKTRAFEAFSCQWARAPPWPLPAHCARAVSYGRRNRRVIQLRFG
jgi:hypothetical protein